jgi:hypothetical protein
MDNKKLAAAMAAVTMYIKTQQEAAAAMAAEQGTGGQAPEALMPLPAANTWGITGRQALMNANTMMQMRMFK